MRRPSMSRWLRLFGLLGVLCSVAGSRWLLDNAVPTASSTLESTGLGCGVAALGMLIWAALSGQGSARPAFILNAIKGCKGWRAAFAGAAALAGPALGATIAGRHISASTGTLALALTPVAAAVGTSAGDSEKEIAGLLWPGLAGLAGLLLLLPEPNVSHWRTDLALLAIPLLGGASAVLASLSGFGGEAASPLGGLPRVRLAQTLLLACGVFLVLHTVQGGGWGTPVSALAIGTDGLSSLLSLAVLLRLGAMGWSAQFLLIPLVTILEGVVLLRPEMTMRSWMGLGLLLLGGVYLLWERSPD